MKILAIHIETIGSQVNLELSGQMRALEAPHLRKQLNDNVVSHVNTVIINLQNVNLIDCAILGVFVGIHRRLLDEGKHLTFVGPNNHVRQLMSMTKLDTIMDIQN